VKDFRSSILLIILIFALPSATLAQLDFVKDLNSRQLKKFAKNSMRKGDVHTAIFFYENYRNHNKYNHKINYELANLQREVRNYYAASELYAEVLDAEPEKYPLARFYYAQMLKSVGNYDEAIKEFDTFRKNEKWGKGMQVYTKLARNEISGCDSAKILIEKPLNVSISNLNPTVNGPHIELSPIPVDEKTFIYASLRVDSLVYFTADNVDTDMPVRQFYRARKEGMDWIGGERVEEPYNMAGVETGNGVFSRDGKRFYFTRCEENWKSEVICSIYRMLKNGRVWGSPEKLPEIVNDPNYTTTQPALGRTVVNDWEIIYFVSDRPEGKGGLDLWYTIWNEEKQLFSKPANLGSKINTAGDEMTPFYNSSKRTLYFSSTGHPGIGGLDIFKSFGTRKKWDKPENLGYPINSSFDDLYFTVSRLEEDGFFVSNRTDSKDKNTCCDDIFYYRWDDFIRITVTGTIFPFEQDRFGRKKDLSNFDFMNPDESILPMEGAKVALYRMDEGTGEYIFLDRYTTSVDGKFYFTLEPDREYEFKMEGLQYFDSKNYLSTDFFNFSDTITMPPTWVNVLTDKPIVLENIYYEFNSANLSQKDKNVIDTTLLILLREAPEFIIEIGAHTDSIGDAEYNLKLSEERAANVVKYLIERRIPRERLVSKGYGASKPVAPNFNPDGTDNVEGRNKNRRTEFRIVGTIDQLKEDEGDEFGPE